MVVILLPLLHGFNRCIMSWIDPYSCLFSSMCNAYADLGSLFFMYLVCSEYLAARFFQFVLHNGICMYYIGGCRLHYCCMCWWFQGVF